MNTHLRDANITAYNNCINGDHSSFKDRSCSDDYKDAKAYRQYAYHICLQLTALPHNAYPACEKTKNQRMQQIMSSMQKCTDDIQPICYEAYNRDLINVLREYTQCIERIPYDKD